MVTIVALRAAVAQRAHLGQGLGQGRQRAGHALSLGGAHTAIGAAPPLHLPQLAQHRLLQPLHERQRGKHCIVRELDGGVIGGRCGTAGTVDRRSGAQCRRQFARPVAAQRPAEALGGLGDGVSIDVQESAMDWAGSSVST